MTTFLEDQFNQLDKITNSFKEDITTLDAIVSSWEELPNGKIEDLSDVIKSRIKNKTTTEIYTDDQGQYVLNFKFEPISIVWALSLDSRPNNHKV